MQGIKFFYPTRLIFIIIFIVSCSDNNPQLKTLQTDDVILAFGDGLTYGVGTTIDKSYPAVLKQLTKHSVINSGVPGEETSGGLERIPYELAKNHPKLVLLCLGGNDLLRKRPYSNIKDNLRQIIKIIQAANVQVILIGVPAPKISLEVPTFYQELGAELHIPVETTTLSTLLGDSQYKSDYIHLNTRGYELMAKAIYDFLLKHQAIKMIQK